MTLDMVVVHTWHELEQAIQKGQITPQNWKNMARN